MLSEATARSREEAIGPRRPGALARPVEATTSLALAAAFIAFYAWHIHGRHARYETAAFDLGLLGQVAWNNLHGRWFETTVMPINYLAEHFSPALVLASPVYVLWPDVEALMMLQAVAVGIAGVGVFLAVRWLARDSASALLVQLAYCLSPATAWVARAEFHPISLAIPAVTFATALLWWGRIRCAGVLGALTLLANEDAALWAGPFGLLVVAVGRRRGLFWGSSVSAVAVAWLLTYMLAVVPAVRPPELGERVPHPNIGAFSQCGSNPEAVARCLLQDPWDTVRRATTPGDRAALMSVFGPTAGLGMLGPSFVVSWLRWVPVLLGNDPPDYRAHYLALLVPAAFLAVAEALGLLRRLAPGLPLPRRLAGVAVALAAIAAYLQGSPLYGGGEYRAPPPERLRRVSVMDRAVQLIPRDLAVSVVSTSAILPHLALRPRIYLLSEGPNPPADYRIYDLRDPYPISAEDLRRMVAFVRADPAYTPILDEDEVLVLKRGESRPDVGADEVFGGVIRLVGYSITPADDRVRIQLYWRSDGAIARDYHFFIHLDGDDGKGFSQRDGELVEGHLPATRWPKGATVRDESLIAAPPLGQWSRYHLEIGWYDLQTGERLRLPDGRDHPDVPLTPTRP